MAKGNLIIIIDKKETQRNNEIGELSKINNPITDAFKKVIGEINMGVLKINEIGDHVNHTSSLLSGARMLPAKFKICRIREPIFRKKQLNY
ncbi:MAG: hypothetical protein PF517_02820 [Salinivirgaceae bacterium]|nr:hypothetical protein [Salinivirgaceae bacterium]